MVSVATSKEKGKTGRNFTGFWNTYQVYVHKM